MRHEDMRGNLIIGEGVEVSGVIVCPGTVTVDGTLLGKLSAAELRVGASGRIEGEVQAGTAIIRGEVGPLLTCSNKLMICATGKVTGTVSFPTLEVELGGQLVGKIQSTSSDTVAFQPAGVTRLPSPESP